MAEEWTVEAADAGIAAYIRTLPEPTRSKLEAHLARLQRMGNMLGPPHTRALGDGVVELRIQGQNAQRVYFAFQPGRRILVLAIGSKKTQGRDIESARAKVRDLR
jgi:putative addiction module killer protein